MPFRIRLTYSKTGSLRYTGHLDFHRVWERIFRRTCIPIAYSKGFHPQVRMAIACALPLGFTSQGELLDLWLENPVPLADIQAMLAPTLPPGLAIHAILEIDEHAPALQTQVLTSIYLATLLDPVDGAWLMLQVERLLGSQEILRSRRDKMYNLRPLIESMEVLPDDGTGQQRLQMSLAAREGATGRPEEVLSALELDPALVRVERLRLVLA